MIQEIKGDLIKGLEEGKVQAILHCANCQKKMNSGVAKALREKWPEVYEADLNYVALPANRLGNITYAKVGEDKFVVNCYGQLRYGYDGERYVNYEGLYSSLNEAKIMLQFKRIKEVGFPYLMAACRAGGDWNIVKAMIESVFKNFNVTIFKLTE